MHQYLKGQEVQIQIPQKMRDEKDIMSRYLVGIITAPDSPSGKSFQALVRPAYGAAVDCHRCGVELKDRDCRKIGYGRDCAKHLRIALPRHKDWTDAEVAEIQASIHRIEPKLLWFPKWKEVHVTIQSQPETSVVQAPVVPARIYRCRGCGEPIGPGVGLCADCLLDQVPTSRPAPPAIYRDSVAVTKPEVTVESLLAIMRQRLQGYEERKQQVQALKAAERVLRGEADSPHLIAELGTGTGKSFVNLLAHIAASAVNREPMILAPPTKALQMQYRKDVDFLQATIGDVRPFVAAEVKGRRNYLCLNLYNDRLEEYRQTGEVSFRSPEAALQFTRDVIPWAQLTQNGDIEDAGFTWELGTRLDLTTSREGCAGKQCRWFEECWANKALKRGAHADVVVTNLRLLIEHAKIYHDTEGHAGVIPLGVIPRGDIDDCPEPAVDNSTVVPRVAIDEAQWLEDVARDALGIEITRGTIQGIITRIDHFTAHHKVVAKARKAVKQGSLIPADQAEADALVRSGDSWQEMLDLLGKVADLAFFNWESRLTKDKKSAMHLGDEADIGGPLLKALDAMRKYVADSQPRWITDDEEPMWTKLRKQLTTLVRECEQVILPGDPDVVVRWMKLEKDEETQREHLTLCCHLISVAEKLQTMLWEQFPHVIAVSATLAGPDGLDHWRRRVGAPPTDELVAPAPFDYSRSLLYLPPNAKQLDPRKDARDPNTERGRDYLRGFLETTSQLITASHGGALILFSSDRALQAAYKGARELTIAAPDGGYIDLPEVRGLADRFEGTYTLMRQRQFPLKEIVAKMKADPFTIVLGLKSFWEGIDIPGLNLRLVIIDSFPFTPPDDPVWDAMCAAEDRRLGKEMAWFSSLGVPTATIAVKQGAGRLVRRAADRGVVAILDGRATITGYGPRIIRALPAFRETRSIHEAARLLDELAQTVLVEDRKTRAHVR